MRSTIALSLLASATAVSAQIALPSSLYGLTFSPQCQAAILSTVTSGSFAQCFPTTDLLPILASNASIIPVLDKFMSDLCYTYPTCSNDTLMTAAMTIMNGCATDLQNEGLSNTTVMAAFESYPVVREVLCLKTVDPYTNASYGGVLGNPPIPITSATYNSTNGTFCVTSVLTQLSAYFGADLSVPYLTSVISGSNTTAIGLARNTSSTILCNECIFAAVDVVEEAYPMVGMVPVAGALAKIGKPTTDKNLTLNALLNGTCAYQMDVVTMNGTLPMNISVSIVNSTFEYPVMNGNATTMSM